MEDEQKNQTAEPQSEEIPAQPYKPFYLKTKIEDMMKYGKKAVASFPRRERQTADEIRATILDMYRLAIQIERKYYKKSTLQELDVNLEILRHLVRLAADKDYYDDMVVKRDSSGRVVKDNNGKAIKVRMQPPLPKKKYEVWCGMLEEIGRIIGGYIKFVKG